jgi:hypothetical protein
MTTLEKNKASVVIDARGPRFSAAITVLVLATALVTQSLPLIAFQLAVFLIVFTIATGFALAAAFLNAAFNYCLGCEFYLILLRARR